MLIILQTQGISVTPILTALGVGGLAVALALQPTLSNLFAGLQIIASGKINHGDYMKLASGEEGIISMILPGGAPPSAAMPIIRSLFRIQKLADMIVTNFYIPSRDSFFGGDQCEFVITTWKSGAGNEAGDPGYDE